jgi:hypothetical protein
MPRLLEKVMNYSRIVRFFMTRFRRKRLESFRNAFPPETCNRIVDVGGNRDIWDRLKYPSEITLVNSDPGELQSSNGYRAVVGDGRALKFADASFDLAFSNSVIEHVGDLPDMRQFAGELRRVGRSYYCQTPNKWFPVEPHLGTMFIHWWPRLLNSYFVVRYLTLWGLMNKPSRTQAATSIANIRLLTRKEFKQLFPDASIFVERFLLLPKSFIAVRR